MAKPEFSFCEPATASSMSRWHIRQLTKVGLKLTGGIDTGSLCGHVKPVYGWDLKVPIRLDIDRVCPECAKEYLRLKDG